MAAATQSKPSEYEAAQIKAYKTLMELGGQMMREEDVERGDKLVIPRGMSWEQLSDYCLAKAREEREEVTMERSFDYRFKDGAVAVTAALTRFFGTFQHKQTMGFWGPNPPAFAEVEVAFGVKEQVAIGAVACPAIPHTVLHLGETRNPELGAVFHITVQTRRQHRAAVEALLGLIEQQLRENSIYKGKAVDAEFNFLDLSKVDASKVVYAEETWDQIVANIFANIRYPEALARVGVKLKSSILLAGTFGVGKTLLAYLTGQECQRAGYTFIQVRPNRDSIEDAVRAAAMHSPSVVFFEDLDTISNSAEAERDHISGLLELFDGVRAKGREVMCILTTNHPELIHKGMLRPGRIDVLIEIGQPDKAGIIKLCKTLIREDLLDPEIMPHEWEAVGEAMEGYLPAFVQQACDRALKYAVTRAQGDPESITAQDLVKAGVELRKQYNLMLGAKTEPERDALSQAFRRTMEPVIAEAAREQALAVIHPRAIHPDNLDESQDVHEAVEKARR